MIREKKEKACKGRGGLAAIGAVGANRPRLSQATADADRWRAGVLFVLLLVVCPIQLAAQTEVETLTKLDFQLLHQRTDHVMKVLDPLLSAQGKIEIDREVGRISVRDHRSNVDRIVTELEEFDHPVRPLRFEVILLRATRSSEPDLRQLNEKALPPTVVEILGFLVNQNLYTLVAQTSMDGHEGDSIDSALGEDRRVSIAAGTVLDNKVGRLPVRFELVRTDRPPETGFVKTLNLTVDRTSVIALAAEPQSQTGWAIAVTSRQLSDLTLPRRGEE